jgi:conjugal transfer ATP-binding protein TraC
MAYQIPQQLEYKEKIMFGLTFRQLLYAFAFGSISLMIFKKIDSLTLGVILATIPSVIGLGFIFFNFEDRIKDYYIYFKFRELKSGDPKLINFFGIKDIKDNFIINSKNKKIAILKVSTINFSLKPKKEKEAVIKSFQKFLNSLDFPTQILMNTESIELEDYLSSLKSRIKSDQFESLFDKYRSHLQDTIKTNKIMNRIFYLIIPEESDIHIQINICFDRLASLNLKSKQLKGLEIKKLLLNFLNGKRSGKLLEAIFPEYIHNHPDHLEIKDQYQRIVYASGYPRYVESGFLDRIISSLGDFDLSIHLKPYPIEGMLIGLNRELQKQRADLYSMQTKGIINPSLEIQYSDTRGTLKDLQKGKERLFNVSLYVNCKADSLNELNLLTKKVESELNSLMILPKTPKFRMLQGLKSIAPLGVDELNYNRNITTDALSAFFPFTSQFLEADNQGVWLGLNRNNIPIIKDIFNLSNPNGLVLSQSGGGKSYFCKLLITRYLLNGTKVMIIDPQGEYKSIVSHFKGQTIDLSKDSDTIINPLDLMGHDYTEKRLSLMDLMKIMLGDLSDIQRAFIDKALTKTYESKGITKNPDTWNNEPPILGDLLKVFKTMERRASKLEKTTINSLANRLDMYVNGVFSFFNKKTNINFNNNFVCFDIGKMPSQVKPATMFLVLDYIYMKMKSNLERKILLIDESWSLLSRTEEAGYIFEIVKTCRKFNLGLLLINQEVEGLLDSKAGKSVLANSSYTLLMRQKPAVIDNICKTFNLSNIERTHLLTAGIGEGLLIMEDDHSEIKVIASPEEHKLITTNADELNVIKNVNQKANKNVQINVDEFKRFFRKSELNKDEINFLLNKGYKISKFKRLASNKKEEFLLKPRHNESLTHLFVVYDTADYLESKGIKVQTYTTKKPDIVFDIGKKKYAIEVETGSVLTKVKNMKEKVKLLNRDYDKWFFIVTNKNKTSEYKKFGDSVDLRYLKRKLINIRRQLKKSHSA